MASEVETISDLLVKAITNALSKAEAASLEKWVNQSAKNKELLDAMTDDTVLWKKMKAYSKVNSEAIWKLTLLKTGIKDI